MAGIDWGRRPEGKDGIRTYKLVRCPTSGAYRVTILSHDMVGTKVHYAGNRTRPCTGEDCESCNRGVAPRWKGYIAAIEDRTGDKVILEVTANVGQRIAAYFDTHRTLQGARLSLKRKGEKNNSPVESQMLEPIMTAGELPQATDVRPILERMWEVGSRTQPPKILVTKPRLAPTGTDGDLGNEKTD